MLNELNSMKLQIIHKPLHPSFKLQLVSTSFPKEERKHFVKNKE